MAEQISFTLPAEVQAAIEAAQGAPLPAASKPLSTEIFSVTAEAKRKAAEERNRVYQIGEMVPHQGIYLGKYTAIDRSGRDLGKTFRVFAAPCDISNKQGYRVALNYRDTVKHVSSLHDWHGFNGAPYTNDCQLYQALKDGTYHGEWVIPPLEILNGSSIKTDNLYRHRHDGAFEGTFKITRPATSLDFTHWYWSCSEVASSDFPHDDEVADVSFVDNSGIQSWRGKANLKHSCRLVRFVEIPNTGK